MAVKNQEKVNERELSPQAKEILAALDTTKKELEVISLEIDTIKAEEGLKAKKPLSKRKEAKVFESQINPNEPTIIFPYEAKVSKSQYENLKKVETRAFKKKAKERENLKPMPVVLLEDNFK